MFSVPALFRPFFSGCRAAVVAAGCVALLAAPLVVRAQTPGQLDPSFLSVLSGGTVYALALQNPTASGTPDLFVGGELSLLGELSLNDGSIVNSLDGIDFGNAIRIVYTAVPETPAFTASIGQPVPKLLIGGQFGRSAGQVQKNQPGANIFRINTDSTLDASFNPGKGANNFVTAILPMDDGSMIVGGLFDQFNGQDHSHIVKLDNSGAIVNSAVFSGSLNFDDTILTLAAQYDPAGSLTVNGQILAGGTFSNVNGVTHTKLARINADGSVDSSFNPSFDDRVRVVTTQPDGKILVGGDFQAVNNTAVQHLIRLNYDGSLDKSFVAQVTTQPPFLTAPPAVNVINLLADGRMYVGGNFVKINGQTRNYLGRLFADGTLDPGFDPGTAIINAVQQVVIDPATNLIYVAETRSKRVDDKFPPTLIRLYDTPPPAVVVLPTISIVTIKRPAVQSTNPADTSNGIFELIRQGDALTNPITVYLTLSGSGIDRLDADYRFKPTLDPVADEVYSVTFPAGQSVLQIRIKPKPETPDSVPGRLKIKLAVSPDRNATKTYNVAASPADRAVNILVTQLVTQ